MIRVLCVEDDPLVRTFLAIRLGLEPDIQVVGQASTAGEALELLRQGGVDVVVLDYHLEGADGMQLLGAITRGNSVDAAPRVLFCTGLADAAFEAEARAVGAAGVVSKTEMASELLPAIRNISGGGAWFQHGAATIGA